MSYKHKYEKYKNKYLKFKQFGGALHDVLITDIINKMSTDELVKLNVDGIHSDMKNAILNKKLLANGDFGKITIMEELGRGSFGITHKAQINSDEYILPKGTIVIAKFVPVTDKNEKELTDEINAHTTITLSGCGLPQLYGYFKDIAHNDIPGKCYALIGEFINGKNLLKEIETTQYDSTNQEHLDRINSWISSLEKTLDCLHKNHIIHGDLKPDNVMAKRDKNDKVTNEAILIDYGFVCKYASFCTRKFSYWPFTSPLKAEAYKKDRCNIGMETETNNDNYALGMAILDILSKTSPFGTKDSLVFTLGLDFKLSAINSNTILSSVNNFISNVVSKNPNVKSLTDKAYKYILMGLTIKPTPEITENKPEQVEHKPEQIENKPDYIEPETEEHKPEPEEHKPEYINDEETEYDYKYVENKAGNLYEYEEKK